MPSYGAIIWRSEHARRTGLLGRVNEFIILNLLIV